MRLFRTALLASCLGLLAAVAGAQGYQATTDINPDTAFKNPELAKIGVDQRLGQPVQKLAQFTDADGKKIKIADLLGKRPIILLPIFYRCTGVCNLELSGIEETAEKMHDMTVGKDFDVVALGINPKETYDLARAKKALTLRTYNRPGSENGWHFLTGDMDDIRAVTDSLGFRFTYDAAQDKVTHPSGVMIVTPNGTISSYILGVNYTPEKLRKFIGLAQHEQVGQKTEEIFFGCICIDPVTGKRSLQIQNVLRLLGVVTVIAVVSMLLVLSGKAHFTKRPAA